MPRVLILSDIHANLAALDAVLAAAGTGAGFDEVWSLGDAVGYGPQPDESVAKLRELGAAAVQGNHELAALGEISVEDFNPYAAAAAEWTMRRISSETRDYLRSLPRRAMAHGFTLVHGSPRDPVWEYIDRATVAVASVPYMDTARCAFGHTHVPAIYRIDADAKAESAYPGDGDLLRFDGERWLINPGSAGQPRDGDPRAAYAVMDTRSDTVHFHRISYDITATQRLMIAAELPDVLVERLSFGR
jgi:diadenosine tetraphosphatase ApaH/serine/threonine PP2A family protein phosphatase